MGNGGSSATSTVKVDNDILVKNVEKTTIVNEQINKLVTNTVVKQASKCSGSVNVLQNFGASGVTTTGDFTSKTSQKANATLNFSCVQGSTVKDTTSTQMLTDLMTGLKSQSNQDVVAKLSAAANSDSSAGVGSSLLSSSKSDANSDIKNKYQLLTEKEKRIVNSVSNTIEKNFESSTIDDCIAQVTVQQSVLYKDIKAANVHLDSTQDASVELMAKCIQDKGVANDITNSVISKFTNQTDDVTSQSAKAEIDATSTSKSKAAGLDDLATSIFGGISGVISSVLGPLTAGPMMSVSLCVSCILLIIVIFFFRFMMSGSVPDIDDVDMDTMDTNDEQNEGKNYDDDQAGGRRLKQEFFGNLLLTLSPRFM
jgi:hypothetical protein